MTWSRLVLAISLFNALLVVTHSLYDTHYACATRNKFTVKVGQENNPLYGIVEFPLTAGFHPNQSTCTVNLEALPGYQLALRFSSLKLDCSRGAYVNVSGQTNSHVYCDWWSNYPALYTTSNFVNITYYTGNRPSSNSNEAVSVYYTAYHTGSCGNNEFRCAYTGRCIPSEVVCDDKDNCGDWYDESVWTCGLTTAMIVAISVSSALAGLSLFICVAASVSRRRKARHSRTVDDTPPEAQRSRVSAEHRHQNDVGAVGSAAAEQVDLKTIVPPGPPPYSCYTNYAMTTIDGDSPAPYYEVIAFGDSPPMYESTLDDKPAT